MNDGYQHCKFCDGNSVVIEFIIDSKGRKRTRYTCLDCWKTWHKEVKDD